MSTTPPSTAPSASTRREVIVKATHRGLLYEDGVLQRVVEAGRYVLPAARAWFGLVKRPETELILVDVRQRDLTLKGQEILTSDKVAIRVSIIVQYRVVDAARAVHEVESYEDRLYSDVQLAARRSLASMTLEDILTNRTKLSDDILHEVKEAAAAYGVAILRADVKDLIFPGNLQEIMNKVLAAERMSQVALVDARTKADVQKLEAETRAANLRRDAEAAAEVRHMAAEAAADETRVKTEADVRALKERAAAAEAFREHPVLLRLRELEALTEVSRSGNAKLFVGFDGASATARAAKATLRDE